MQKRAQLKLLAIITLLLTISSPIISYADGVHVVMDQALVSFTPESGIPFTDATYRTQVPLRQAMESFGAVVTWDQENQVASVEKEDILLMIPVGTNYIIKDGEMVLMDTTSIMIDNKVYLPIRPILESFGATVSWDQFTQTVTILSPTENPTLTIHYIDVGQGDSTLIDFGDYEILIDAGLNAVGQTVVEYITPFINGNLELVIATHAHADHIGGLDDVINTFQVDTILDSGDVATTLSYKNYFAAASAEPNCTYTPDSNMVIDLGNNATFEILDFLDGDENLNNNSVISLLTYQNVKVLFMGDAEKKAEEIGLPFFPDVDVLKVGHHGSRTSSSPEFLSVVQPEFATISAGKENDYKHPHRTTLKNLWDIATTVYGTLGNGTMILNTDGTTYYFNNLLPLR